MPYIAPKDRARIADYDIYDEDKPLLIKANEINCGGDLQYAIAEMINSYLERKGMNYQHCQDMLGALVGAQMEFNTRVVAPYEMEKIAQNGGVYKDWRNYPKPEKY